MKIKSITCSNFSATEIADLLEKEDCCSFSGESAADLARMLRELNACRNAIYEARCAFGKAEKIGLR